MPELPDVEGFRRYFKRFAEGRRVVRADVPDRELLRNRSPGALGREIVDRRLGAARRHGKWLIVPAGEVELLMHFGMTGLLHWSTDLGDRHRHDRLILCCEGGELRYRNMRRFGGVWVAADPVERERVTGSLGPDAAGLSSDEFHRLLEKRRGGIKAALMDQHLLAGVGNLLADEALWRAGIHPAEQLRGLSPRRISRLFDSLDWSIRESNKHGRIPPIEGWLTGARDRRDARCPRCETGLRKDTIAGRTACWCPRCQRRRHLD